MKTDLFLTELTKAVKAVTELIKSTEFRLCPEESRLRAYLLAEMLVRLKNRVKGKHA